MNDIIIAIISGLCVAIPSIIATVTANKKNNDLIAYTDEETYIYFYKSKLIEFRNDGGVDYRVFQAINKQVEELGWEEKYK